MVVLSKKDILMMNMPEYMRVRMYLYNLVAKSSGKDTQIPSENDLCRLFDVSRITVRSAIQGLVKDRFLIPRQGIGTFINPEKVGKGVMNTPTVGVIAGDGRNVTNNPFDLSIANAIVQSGMNFETLFLPNGDSPERLVEMVKAGVDAVIWIYSNYDAANLKYLKALQDSEIPLLSIETDHLEFNCNDSIITDPKQRGIVVADYLFSHGITTMLFIHNYPAAKLKAVLDKGTPHQACSLRLAELAGSSHTCTETISLLDLEEKLKKTPDFINKYQVIYSLAELAPYVMGMLGRTNITVPSQISYLLFGPSDPHFFHGLRPTYVDNQTVMRRSVIEWLELRMYRNCRSGRFERHLNMEIIPGETVMTQRTSVSQAI